MSLNYHAVKNWDFGELERTYTRHDTMLYALALGIGTNPADSRQLRFVYEKNLVALPTIAVILGFPGFWMSDPRTGITASKIVHGEQSLRLHRTLAPEGTITARSFVRAVIDKGPGRGALVVIERRIKDKSSGQLLATLEQTTFCRADGGYSVNGQPSDPPVDAPPATPDRAADDVTATVTRPEMALLYRLSGDLNPLHADPCVASAAGFERPILHGLATYGIAARVILQRLCNGDPSRFKSIRARFSAPVYPGETLRTELWASGGTIHFRVTAVERDVVAISAGMAEVAGDVSWWR
ncbi:maoC like domain protein [Paraburkholderia fungorum]|uniref:MaoC like domain protein n=1 Tax=Paraburkholderia fungorum TaxID=134537 RepID=A0AAU8T619_9BURK|nr:MaoC/PaaZ C-terminal domain-containing protein [Paraburkholderia fungorum]AJZ56993.1 maoC like domain protein [Paraburkholderia fungorum]